MREVQDSFAQFLSSFTFSPPSRPVIANFTAAFYGQNNVADFLLDQIIKPVRWTDSVNRLLQNGAEEFLEINGRILGKMVEEIRQVFQ